MAQDPYDILQVAHHAEPEVVEAAYRRLARKYHPDTNSSANATAHMQEINWAYEILKDPAKRASYDRGVKPQAAPKSPPPKSPPPKPPPAQPKPPPPKPKPPPPKPKAEPAKKASARTQTRPPLFWKPIGPTERRLLRWIGAIGLILIAWFAINYDPPPAVPASTAPPQSNGTVTLDKRSSTSVSLFNSDFRVQEQIPDGTICNEIGRRIWPSNNQGGDYEMIEIECPEFDAKGFVHLYNTDKYVPPTEPPPTVIAEAIGTVTINHPEGDEMVMLVDQGFSELGEVPNGSVCNLLREETREYFEDGEYHPFVMYDIYCPEFNLAGWIEAEWTE